MICHETSRKGLPRIAIAVAIAVAILAGRHDDARAATASPSPPAAAMVTGEQRLDHISVVQIGKAGSPVILIPGLATPRAVWDGIAPDLARTHRVYLVQVNGFAGDDPAANLKPGILAGAVADLHGYIVAQRLAGAAVIGHSLGGLSAMMLARAHPADAGRLMIVDALPFFGVLLAPPGSPVTPAMLEPQAAQMRAAIVAQYGHPASPEAADQQTRGMTLTPAAHDLVRRWAATADARVVGEAMYEDLTTDLRADLPALKMPVTLVYPWHDGAFPREQTAAFYRAQYAGVMQFNMVEVPGAAHFLMLDQPSPFAAAVEKFLQGGA